MRILLRLWKYLIIIVALVLITVLIFQIFLLPYSYNQNISERIELHTAEMTQILDKELIVDLSSLAKIELTRMIELHRLRLELFDSSGRQVFFSGWGENLVLLSEQEWRLVFSGGYLSKSLVSTGLGEVLVCAKALYERDEITGFLLLASLSAPLDDTLSVLLGQLIMVIAISFIISTAFAYGVSRLFVKPIRDMETLAKAISNGNYDQKVVTKDKTELGDLARAINAMADQLAQVEAMRQDFIATVSHQFKTPLSIIQGHTELLADTLPTDIANSYGTNITAILEETDKLNQMAKDILQLTKVRSSQPKKQEIRLLDVCHEIGGGLEMLFDCTELVISVSESILVWADRDMLCHIIQNLLHNAYSHAHASVISLSAELGGNGWTNIKVKDDGIGLTKQQQQRLFERFYKGDPKNRSGTGLGMSIVKAMLESHGAQYGVVSDNGTEIWFSLPPKDNN